MTVPPPPPPPPGSLPPPPPPPPAPASGWAGMRSLRDEPSPYSVLLAIVVVVIMSAPNLVFLALDSVIQPAMGDTPRTPSEGELVFGLVVALVLQLIIFVVAMVPLLIRRNLDRRLFGPTQPTGSWLGLGFGAAAGMVALFSAYGVNIVLSLVVGIEDPVEQQLLQDALAGGATLLIAAFIAVVVAPIVEEVVFRGILFRALGDRVGVWLGAVISSAVFALIHVEVVLSQPVALGGLFAVGLVLALAYQWTGNLLVPILGHAVFNAASVGLALAIEQLGVDEVVALGWGAGHLAVHLIGVG